MNRSLCKAAAISSVVQLFVLAVRRLAKIGRWGSFLLEWVRDVVDYVLTYAVCFIAIYGLSFSEGDRRFCSRGKLRIAHPSGFVFLFAFGCSS